jgi:hypothetical protein
MFSNNNNYYSNNNNNNNNNYNNNNNNNNNNRRTLSVDGRLLEYSRVLASVAAEINRWVLLPLDAAAGTIVVAAVGSV